MNWKGEKATKSSSQSVLTISSQETSLVYLAKSLEYVNIFFEKGNDFNIYIKKEMSIAEIKKSKAFYPVQIRKTVIDFDSVTELFLDANRSAYKKKYKNLFVAADVDSYGSIKYMKTTSLAK